MSETPPTESVWPPPIPPPPDAGPKPLTHGEAMFFKYRGLYALTAALSLFAFVMIVVNHSWQGGHWYRLAVFPFNAALFTFYAFRGFQLARDIETNRRTLE